MNARDRLLDRVRTALAGNATVPPVGRDYRTDGDLDQEATLALLAARVDEYTATVHRTTPADLPATIAAVLERAAAARVVVPAGLPDGWLHAVPGGVDVLVDDGGLTPAELDGVDVVVTGSAVAIAVTGTVILDAAPDQGRRAITLVPDHHVCVVLDRDVVETVPEGIARLEPTRPLTMISGPSATSDIELDRVEGVHGPRTLDVIIVTTR